jgi:hypothetical protein
MMPGKATTTILPPGSAIQQLCLAALCRRKAGVRKGPIGDRVPLECGR